MFSAAEVQRLLARCRQWFAPGGQLLIEVHTWEEVKRQGQMPSQWQRCPQGLFLPRPHLLLTEHMWDDAARTSSTLFWVIEEQGEVTRFGSQMTAWHNDDYLQLLKEAGFRNAQFVSASDWPASETFDGKLLTLLAQAGE